MNQAFINNFLIENKDSIRSLDCFIFSLQKKNIQWRAIVGSKFKNSKSKLLFLQPEGLEILKNILLVA